MNRGSDSRRRPVGEAPRVARDSRSGAASRTAGTRGASSTGRRGAPGGGVRGGGFPIPAKEGGVNRGSDSGHRPVGEAPRVARDSRSGAASRTAGTRGASSTGRRGAPGGGVRGGGFPIPAKEGGVNRGSDSGHRPVGEAPRVARDSRSGAASRTAGTRGASSTGCYCIGRRSGSGPAVMAGAGERFGKMIGSVSSRLDTRWIWSASRISSGTSSRKAPSFSRGRITSWMP